MREELLSMSVPCGLRIFAGAYSVLTASVFSPADIASLTMCIRTYNKRSGEEEGKHLMTRARKKRGEKQKTALFTHNRTSPPPQLERGKRRKRKRKGRNKSGEPLSSSAPTSLLPPPIKIAAGDFLLLCLGWSSLAVRTLVQ